MSQVADTPSKTGRRALRIAANVALVAAVLVATSPWTSGAYTWVAQRMLAARMTASGTGPTGAAASAPRIPAGAGGISAGSTSAVGTSAAAWRGWAREDARAWGAAKPGDPVARISARRIGLDAVVVKGAHEGELARGPGWVVGTSVPGASGNVGISGHRTTYLAPFRDIDRLTPGDTLVLETRWRRYTYRVSRRWFADPDDVTWLLPTRRPTLTLTSCHPPYSDRFRIVVTADLASVSRR